MSADLVAVTTAEASTALSQEEAEKLDRRIRRMAEDTKGKLDTLGALVAHAKCGRIHEALGYPSWTAYLADALGELCSGQGIETRRQLVTYLYDNGMSERAIAAATGASKTTIHRDLATAESQVVLCGPPSAGVGSEAVDAGLDDAGEAEPMVTNSPVSQQMPAEPSGQMAVTTTTGLDGKNHPRGRKKRPRGQAEQKKPRKTKARDHATELANLLERSLKRSIETLEALIPNELDASVTPGIAKAFADRIDNDVAIFTRIGRQLRNRAEEVH